jgi:hypothetical protein
MQNQNTDVTALTRILAERAGVNVFEIDKGASMAGIIREAEKIRQLKKTYGVRFLPRQVIRRSMNKGINPFKD